MSRRKRALVALGLVVATLPMSSELGRASFAGDNGKIAFGRMGARPGIRVMRRDGKDLRRLTTERDGFPEWSPDGTRIAFPRFYSDAPADVFVMNADGSDLRLISSPSMGEGCGLQPPRWSYDGLFLAYADDCFDRDPRVAQLRIVTADGSSEVALTDYSAFNGFGSQPWSPNLEESSQLVYTSNAEGSDTEVYVVNSDGTDPVRLTDDADDQLEAQWSPAGGLIAFSTQQITASGNPKGFLEVIAPTGEGRRVIAEGRFSLGQPLWSPDGSMISFTRYTRQGFPTAYVTDPDGSGEIEIGKGLTTSDLAWAPNSASLIFPVDGDIVRVRLATLARKALTSGSVYDSGPDQQSR